MALSRSWRDALVAVYFTKLVLPTLLSTAKSPSDGTARVVNTSSNGHLFGGLKYDTKKDGPARKKTGIWELYGQSKTVSFLRVSLGSTPLILSPGQHCFLRGADAVVQRSRHRLNLLKPW